MAKDIERRERGAPPTPPAISPIAGQNPGFQVFTNNVASGTPVDYTSYYLANLNSLSSAVPGDWREGYVFTQAYAQKRYLPESVTPDVRPPQTKINAIGPIPRVIINERGGIDAPTYPHSSRVLMITFRPPR